MSAQITPSVGLVSGINTGQIISELVSLDAAPVTQLENRIDVANAQTQAYQLLGTQLQSLQNIGQSLELPTTFGNTTATSSDQTVLTATSVVGAAAGSYDFNVASLVTSQQAISNGYSSPNALVGAGTITISQGGGQLSSQTTLAELNGGTGVDRGQFRITDGSGSTAVIDLSTAVTLDDVVNQINNSTNISVHASIQNNQLELTDTSGQTKSKFSVQDLGDGTAAEDLGISGSTSGTTITGANINTIAASTPLSQLNDGLGIGLASSGAADFQVNLSDGSNVQVSLAGAQTVGDVINDINNAGGSKLKASIDTATNSITLTDTSGGAGTTSVTALNNSTAAQDLGFLNPASGSTVQGNTLLASLDSVLVSSLNGGSGIPLGTISITDSKNVSKNVDLSGATSVQNIIDDINKAGLPVTASLNSAGDGIQIQDNSGGSGSLVIGDANSTTATALGIKGTFSSQSVNGGDLHSQYVSDNTLLSDYNGGQGVDLGTFSITNSKGQQATVNLSQGTFTTVGDVINAINSKSIGVTASINSTGDGILLTDTAGGTSKLSVNDVSGTSAADLNIAGTATGTGASNTINGSLTKTIAVTSTDTLTTLQQKINQLGFGVSATIVNDGSGNNGYHLALSALNPGLAGSFTFDTGATSLSTQNVVDAQNAAVFYGGTNSSQSLLVTSNTNQLTGIIPGVTIQLQGTGAATLNVAPDSSGISTQLQNFTDTFNDLVNEINTLTQWNTTTNTGGLLLGDSTVQDIQQNLYNVFDTVVNGAGKYKLFSDLGLSINSDGTIAFNSSTFTSAYAADPTSVQNLFTQTNTGLGAVIDNSMTQLVDPVSGEVTRQETTLSTQIQGFQSQITQLNALLAEQQNQLETEFANMETVLAQLKSQGSVLSSIGTLAASSSSSSSSGTSSSSG